MIKSYTITETLRASGSIVLQLQRGFRSCDRRRILLKRSFSRSPSPETVRQLNHEWAIATALGPDRVLRPLALEPHAQGALLVLENFQGVPLRRLLGAPMDIGHLLQIAVAMMAAVEELQEHGIVHKDIRPDSILVEFETAEVKLTDLELASLLPREHHETRHPSLIGGALPCMSPEQTGRMNRAIGLPTEMFSLGLTSYERLTGDLPFRAADPPEWAHGRLAPAPRPPEEVAPGAPEPEQRFPHLPEPRSDQSTAAVVAREEQLDLMAVLQASQAISREIVLSRLLETLVRTIVQQAGAQKAILILARNDELRVAAEARSGPGEIQVLLEDRKLSSTMVPESVILHVRRSRERVLPHDAGGWNLFSDDPYFAAERPRSVLCLPILGQTEIVGVLYLESDLLAGTFTPNRLTAIELLVSQAAISLQNAMLYADLEQAARIVRSTPTVLLSWRPGPELVATYVSHNVSSVFGYRPCDLLSGAVTFSSLVHPDDRERVLGEIAAYAAADRDGFEQEYRVVCADGRIRWVDGRTAIERDAMGRICHYQSILADITEKRAADEPRRRSEELLRAIVENTTAIVYAKDTERRILTLNRRFAEVWGVPVAELIGTTGDEVLPAEVAEKFRESDLKAMEARAPVQMEMTLPQPDGVHTYISLKVPLCDASGGLHGVCGICTDITERVEAEKECERLLREAQEALRIRDEFLLIASHELKTPLTPLRLHMQLLRRHLSDPALAAHPKTQSFYKLLEISNHQLERLTKLVDDLLDVSRISAGQLALQLEDVDLASLARDAAEGFCQELSSAGSRLSLCASEPVVGRWDRFRIEQVVVNLLANAVKYGKGKPITLGVRRRGALVELRVQDHGIGIPREVQDRIFERFERVVSIRSFGGLGLGLYITRQIIEAHRGTIRVRSAPDQGATFTVELPIGGS